MFSTYSRHHLGMDTPRVRPSHTAVARGCYHTSSRDSLGIRLSWTVCCLLVAAAGIAQEPTQPAPRRAEQKQALPSAAPNLTLEAVQERAKAVEDLPDLSEAQRAELRALYQQAVQALTAAADYRKRAQTFAQMASEAPQHLADAKFRKSTQPHAVNVDVPSDATLAKLESLLKAEEEKLAEAKRRVEQLKAEPAHRHTRLAEIPEKLKTLQDERQRLLADLATLQGNETPMGRASATRTVATIRAIDAERDLYEQELAAYSATVELLPISLELAERDVSVLEKQVEIWRKTVEQRRTEKVRRQETNARLAAERVGQWLKPLAQRNRDLAHESAQLVAEIQRLNRELDESRQLLEKIESKFELTRRKVEQVGLNYAIGLLLRNEVSSLPDVSKYERNSRQREETIRDVQLRMIDLAVARSKLTDVDFVSSFVARITDLPTDVSRAELEREVGALAEKQLELLTTLQQNENAYFERLVELDSTGRRLCEVISDYDTYINERVLWIRSSDVLGLSDMERSGAAFAWIVDRSNWTELAVGMQQIDLRPTTVAALALTVLWGFLLLLRPRLQDTIEQLGERAGRGSCRSYRPTFMTLAWTLLLSITWPALIFALATWLGSVPVEHSFSDALRKGLVVAGFYYGALEFLRQVCRQRGLADSHFGWPSGARAILRHNLRWFMTMLIAIVCVVTMLYADARSRSEESLDVTASQESAARLLIIVLLLIVSVFVHKTLRPGGVLFRSLGDETPDSRLYRWRRALYGLVMLLLGFLLLLTIIGYDFTVAHLARRFFESVLLLEILLIVFSLVSRWLVITRRQMAIAQAQARQALTDTSGRPMDHLKTVAYSENEPDLTAVSEQSRRLLQTALLIVAIGGLWYIWTDVIPALGFLERFELWSVTQDGTTTRITVIHAIVALLIFVAMVLAARNIPGLLEVVVLSRLPLDAGNRYAIITICRYAITIVGLILAFGAIGIRWATYQWLVAAMTVGLGFGLQEIFANFVSGVIVLFEQPIRVGDVVTIDNVTGVVSKIRMRATTVTNWEHQEFIVPNREFITGRLLNWTLSNTVNRVVISVGVAYGTDPNLVKRLLLEIASDHPNVLDDPAPNVTFSEFADSTLNIVLRCYLPDLKDRLSTIHDLNTTTQQKLNDAGVVFAFPTRDVFVHSADTPDAL